MQWLSRKLENKVKVHTASDHHTSLIQEQQLTLNMSAPTDDPSFLVCKRGDLLLVEKDKKYSPEAVWIRATNQRTDATAMVSRDKIQFLPTLTKPSEEMLVTFLSLYSFFFQFYTFYIYIFFTII